MGYIVKAVIAWAMGIVPYFEIYVAVPASIGMGLDPVSAVFWAGLGNFTAVPVVVVFYSQLCKVPRLKNWLLSLPEGRYKKTVDKYGDFFMFILTPLAGIWVAAAVARAVGFPKPRLYVLSALCIILYGSVTALLTVMGIELIF